MTKDDMIVELLGEEDDMEIIISIHGKEYPVYRCSFDGRLILKIKGDENDHQ